MTCKARIAGVTVGLLAGLLGACVTAPVTLESIALDPDANRLTVTKLSDGLMSIPVDLGQGEPVPFILDTGATRSVLFADRMVRLPDSVDDGQVRIHGMFGVEITPAVTLPRVSIGTDTVENLSFAVLPSREDDDELTRPWGILGMDVLARYRLFAPGRGADLILMEAKGTPPIVPENWGRVQLTKSPFNDRAKSLRFLDVRVNGKVASALLDTGSAINVLTYEFADFPAVRHTRRRMRERWKVQGALGTFQPNIILEGVDLRAGSRVWYDRTFVVKDVDSLAQLGVVGQPFMIAGVDLLSDETFYLDLSTDELRMPRALPPKTLNLDMPGLVEIQLE